MRTAQLIQKLPASKTVSIQNKVFSLKHQGHKIINLAGGEPDFTTPTAIIDEANRAMHAGFTHYVSTQGIPELLNEITNKLLRENGVHCDPSQIIVTAGGKPALYLALTSLLNEGDEVLVMNPAWVSYEPLITMAHGVPVTVDLDPENHFAIDKQKLLRACTDRTKAIIVNNPNNPTGRVLTLNEINVLKEVAKEKDLVVISDEVYEKLVFDNHRFIALASVPELQERTMTVQSFSKGQAMTGWRLGYLVLPKDFVSAAVKIQGHLATCTTAFIQYAGVTALQMVDEVEYMRKIYDQRINNMVAHLNRIPGVSCANPEGAFYLFPKIEFKGFSSNEVAEYLLDRVKVAVTPGAAFGSSYDQYLRLSCAAADEELQQAAQLMEQALTEQSTVN
ncbi:pyridoxal phosphate-dependent aminotransferase [Sporolactobacillus terrae]|uniref:Aminotransferase n=1 Tax=Sporolactobacillus terrae TaxID=269673 RepID=A0A5K7WW00_9BACL|nr:pyridoxal phosphate-dependent aminotransferase [Sporolactobacillus terrae]BBN97879.1 aspartate aminotransferase [Sporolactobacillus terrae]